MRCPFPFKLKITLGDTYTMKQSIIRANARTDAGVLERRQAERTWSCRDQDGVASEHQRALPHKGEESG